MARHLFVWLLIATSGCSLALDGPKPNRPKGYAPKCDDSKGLVVADGLLATAVGIGALSAFGESATEAGVTLGLIGLAFTASAIRGNGVVNECREEQALFAQESVPSVPFPEDDDVAGRPARSPMARPVAPIAPVATAPSDPYGEPREAPPAPPASPPAPVRPPTPAPAAIKPAKPAPNEPAPADIDPEAWREFWTEVP